MKKKEHQQFVTEASAAHKGRYQYPEVYRSSQEKIAIYCPLHGIFHATPNNHLRGRGCKECGRTRTAAQLTKSQSEYLNEILAKYGDTYDYCLVDYEGAFEPITLICHDHGVCTKPAHAWLKHGCYKCGIIKRSNKKRIRKDTFLSRAKKIHGDKYSYDRAVLVRLNSTIEILCPKHGAFTQLAASHLRGSGCRECAIEQGTLKPPRSQSEFVILADQVHESFYDYSKTVYQGHHRKLTILCPQHGEFEQYAGNHLKGHGCRFCAGYGRTTEEFIEAAKSLHGEKYDYSQTVFQSVDAYVTIVCHKHGPFQQRAFGHLHGKGCKECKRDAWRISRNAFLERARLVHGSTYLYDAVVWGSSIRHPVNIICRKHGEFLQTPLSHMEGHGCIECSFDERRLTFDEFLERATDIHGTRYIYHSFNSTEKRTEVSITCRIHGDFVKAASDHLKGIGCSKCSLVGQYSIKAALRGDYGNLEDQEVRTLYVAKQTSDSEACFLNVGLSKHGYDKRYGTCHPYGVVGIPDRLVLPLSLAALAEQIILLATKRFHYVPKRSFAGGATECRTLDAEPVIEELLSEFSASVVSLVSSDWIRSEALRHGLVNQLEEFREKLLGTVCASST